jgi:hypothetical protein
MTSANEYQPPQRSLLSELKRLLSSFVAFAAAVVVLAIQGSIEPKGLLGLIGLGVFVATIPLGIMAYILFHKVLESESVPNAIYKAADWMSTLALSGLFTGFIFILADFNALLCGILVFSLVISFLAFRWILRLWERLKSEENSETQKDAE